MSTKERVVAAETNRFHRRALVAAMCTAILLSLVACGGTPVDLVEIPLEFSQVHPVDTVLVNDTAYIDIRVYNPGDDSVWVPYDTNAFTLWPVDYARAYERGDYLFDGPSPSLISLGRGASAPGFWLGPDSQTVLPESFLFTPERRVARPDSTAYELRYSTTDFQLNYGVGRRVQGRQVYYSQKNATPFQICARIMTKK